MFVQTTQTVKVKAVNSEGLPVSNIEIELHLSTKEQILAMGTLKSDVAGHVRWILPSPLNHPEVSLQLKNSEKFLLGIRKLNEEGDSYLIIVADKKRLTGLVQSPQEGGAANTLITVLMPNSSLPYAESTQFSHRKYMIAQVRTDNQGRFSINDIPAVKGLVVLVHQKGYQQKIFSVNQDSCELLKVTLKPHVKTARKLDGLKAVWNVRLKTQLF